jgi:hypothetical protein
MNVEHILVIIIKVFTEIRSSINFNQYCDGKQTL